MDPSLLEYARYHGIACDYAATNPLMYIDDTFKPDPDNTSPSQTIRSECEERLHAARKTLDQRIRGEKLRVSKGSARFLTSLIHEAQTKHLSINWDDILPDAHQFDAFRIEPPIFRLKRETEVKLSKKPWRYSGNETDLQADESHEIANLSNPFKALQERSGSLIEQAKNEKIKCSMGSFALIQSVRREPESSVGELDGVLKSMLDDTSIPAESPVLLPLCANDIPPSPLPIADEFVLPSPVSVASIELDLYWRHKSSCVWRPSDNEVKGPQTSIPTQQDQYECPDPADEDELDSYRSRTEKQTVEGEFTSTDVYKEGKALFGDELATLTGFLADISSPKRDEPEPPSYTDRPHDELSPAGTVQSNSPVDNKTGLDTSTIRKVSMAECSLVNLREELLSASQPDRPESRAPLRGDLPKREARDVPQQGTKTRKINHEHPAKQSQPSQGTQCGTAPDQKRPDSHPLRVSLGSLSSFMETRGKNIKKRVLAKSPYFVSKGTPTHDAGLVEGMITHVQQPPNKPDISASRSRTSPPITAIQVPLVPFNHEGIVLFLSINLLKTHLALVQSLERTEHGPKVIYRDYAENNSKRNAKTPQGKPPTVLPDEADIIISPKTGILLTTSQAAMQLYLPGHKSTGSTNISKDIKSINSPLRETIFRLASRYDQLYIFISHSPDQSKRSKPRMSNPHLTADKHLLASLASLSAFCTSLFEHSSVIPLLVPSIPESMAAWVLALAHKHVRHVPSPGTHSYGGRFTPVNPKPQLGGLLGDAHENSWEAFLRRAGLNPFAAQVVLAVLKKENDGMEGDLEVLLDLWRCTMSKRGSYLGREILGERVLRRVEALIERGWQCDWALNFDGGIM